MTAPATVDILPGSRVILRDEYRMYWGLGDDPEQRYYIGRVLRISPDGYATVRWDHGHETDEWVGFIPRDTNLLAVPKTATCGDRL